MDDLRGLAGFPYDRARQDLNLTPQEQYLYQQHLMNLWELGGIQQPGGGMSTLLQGVGQGPGGGYYNVPTIWGGQQYSMEQAMPMAGQQGWYNWPSYRTPGEADARYDQMHPYMDQDVGLYRYIKGW